MEKITSMSFWRLNFIGTIILGIQIPSATLDHVTSANGKSVLSNICQMDAHTTFRHFHKAPRRSPTLISTQSKQTHAGGFRGGTRKGLDLTFGLKDGSLWTGDVASQPSGGILLRSMLRVEDKVVISGPSLLVDEILRVFDAPNLKTLVSTTWGDSLFALRRPDHKESTVICMHLVKKESVGTCPIIHTSPRVGLDLSHPSTKPEPSDNRVAFIGRLHRFYRHPELLVHNGRLQTFVGLLCDLRIRKGTEASLNSHLAATGKFTPKSVEKYLSEFRRGQSSGKLDKFVQLDGKGSSTPSTYLNLMGTLHRMGLLI